jgi:hypothetical protein
VSDTAVEFVTVSIAFWGGMANAYQGGRKRRHHHR